MYVRDRLLPAFAARANISRMSRGSFLRWSSRLGRGVLLVGTMTVASFLTPGCLTPDFSFDDENAGDGDDGIGQGGDGNVGNGSGGNGASHCTNRSVDADETDTDCGGMDCSPCGLGRVCKVGSDCVNGSCTNLTCQDPSCTDSVKNSDETDVDCGGDGCPPCVDGEVCVDGTDCVSKICQGGICAAATCDDRVVNGNESDIDCGGSCDPCDSGSECVVDGDCLQPEEGLVGVATCEQNVCSLTCQDGFGDCNSKAADGCETDTGMSLSHCGACDQACEPDNAVGLCQGGNCLIDTEAPATTLGCTGTFRNCNNLDDDGCETNINTDIDFCGSCETPCSEANGTATCASGNCSIACDDGFENCDTDARSNGCEVNTNTNATYCGGCDAEDECDDATPTQSAFCSMGTCGYTDCAAGTGDCNGDGTCNDALTTVADCGSCGNDCTVSNGNPACQDMGGGNYACGVLSCSSGGGQVWNDCDDLYVNGCEVNTQSNKFRCGGCLPGDANGGSGQDCTSIESDLSKRVTATECSAGGCRIVSCATGYADCNGVFSDGCEINTTNNKGHCGGCTSGPTTTWDGGFVCDNLYANGTGTCSAGSCGFNSCNTDYGDCNTDASLGSSGNGCETYLVGNDENCGTCGNLCSTAGAGTSGNVCTASSGRACSPTCANGNWGNCDSNGSNGCEANLLTTEATCGSCGINCNSSIGSNQIAGVDCGSGSCSVASCNAGRADCNGTFGDGCEINTTSSSTHCGGCTTGPTITWDGGTNCTSSIGSNSITGVACSTSACRVTTCGTDRADCDGTFSNGCEVNTNSSTTHCGGCTSGPTTTWDGGVACASKTNANRSCNGTCSWTCQAGWKDSNGDLQNTTSNGCETAIIGIINTNTTATGSTSGDLTFTHDLQTSRATNNKRAVVLILGNNSNDVGLPPPVTYNGSSMTMAVETYFNQASIQIYYILDAALPASATTATINIDGNANNEMRWAAQVMELTNIDQSAPVGHFVSQGAGGSACNADLTVNTNADALVVSGLTTQGNDTLSATSGQTVMQELLYSSTNSIAGYFQEVPAGTRRVQWGCSDFEWAHALIAFNPEGTD